VQVPSDVVLDQSFFEEYFRAHPDKVKAVLAAVDGAAEPFMESDDDDDEESDDDDDDDEDLEVADGGGSAHMTATEHRQVTLGLVEGMTGLAKAKESQEKLLLHHENRFDRLEKRINALERQRQDESKSKSAGGFLGGIFS